MAEAAIPGDPAVFAPPGWPLRIGDTITDAEWIELDRMVENEGPVARFRGGEYYSALGLVALHLLGDQVYSADFAAVYSWGNRRVWPDRDGFVYRGHFPAEERVGPQEDNEHELPPEFRGKIDFPDPKPPGGPERRYRSAPWHTSDTPPWLRQAIARVDSTNKGLPVGPCCQWKKSK